MLWKLAVSLFLGSLGLFAFLLLLCACILSGRRPKAMLPANDGLPEAGTGKEAPKRFDAEEAFIPNERKSREG